MVQLQTKVAKYLHPDGTIDENPGRGGGGADLEDNKTATIDVSTYTEPVEIEPTAGKDGMKKATVTLTNIPSGGGILSLKCYKRLSSVCFMKPNDDIVYQVVAANGTFTISLKYDPSMDRIYRESDTNIVYTRYPEGDLYTM